MNGTEIRRPLEDVIGELVDGLSRAAGARPTDDRWDRLRMTGVEVALPVETRVLDGPSGPVVHADMPTMRTRTAFDLPVGRLSCASRRRRRRAQS
jgi:hypothetical protein